MIIWSQEHKDDTITTGAAAFGIYKCCFFDIWHFQMPPDEFHQMSNILILHILRVAAYFNSASSPSHLTPASPTPHLDPSSCSGYTVLC